MQTPLSSRGALTLQKKSRKNVKCYFLFSNIVAFSASLFISVASVLAEGKGTESDSATVIRKTALYLQQTSPASEYSHSDSDVYIPLIKPLIARGNAASSELRALKLSGSLPPFEARVVEMLIARIERPDRFKMVDSYLVPKIDPWADLLRNSSKFLIQNKISRVDFRVLDLELMHPIVRSAVAKYPKAYEMGKQAYNELLEQAKPANRNGNTEPIRLSRELDDKLDHIRREARTSDRDNVEVSYVLSACGSYMVPPKLDPDFLIAWEEGMVRPIPWVVKSSLVAIVTEFNNPASIPSLGELLRQAVQQIKVEPDNYDPVESSYRDALRALFKFTNKEAARELSEIVRITPIEKRRVFLQIGGNLDKPAWQNVLNELEADPSMREHRERLLHVIEDGRANIRASPAKTKVGSESLGLPYKLGYKSGATESE